METIATERERFWDQSSFVVIGNSVKGAFPRLTYRGLKKAGKTVYPIDPGASAIEGDKAFPDLASLPVRVDAAVLELPSPDTALWVQKAADAGIKNLWLHMDTETPEALEVAARNGQKLWTGTCAVMYLDSSFPHCFHRWIMKRLKKY